MGTLERRLREKNQRKKSILEVAGRLFKTKGFFNTTIEEIAREAELSVGTVYLYYKSKEELYVSMVFEAMDIFGEHLQKILNEPLKPSQKIRKVWDFFYIFKLNYPFYFNILLLLNNKEFTEGISKDIINEINKKSGRNFRLAEQIVMECMKSGFYKKGDPRTIVDVLWSLFIGLVQLTETRKNLGIETGNQVAIFQKAFNHMEKGLQKIQKINNPQKAKL